MPGRTRWCSAATYPGTASTTMRAPSFSPTSQTRRDTTSSTAMPSVCWDYTYKGLPHRRPHARREAVSSRGARVLRLIRWMYGGRMGQSSQRPRVALVDLDGQTVPEWVLPSLEQEGIDLVVHDCKTRAELAAHASDSEVIWLFGGSRILQGGNLDVVPCCRAILRTGSGTDNVPVEEATRRQIVVANTPE